MAVKYRAVMDGSGNVIAIGYDEGQGGQDYPKGQPKQGVWCDFTFDTIPEVPDLLMKAQMAAMSVPHLKVVGNAIVAKTEAELTTEFTAKKVDYGISTKI